MMSVLLQLLVVGLVGAGAIAALRLIYARSRLFGAIVVIGLALRLISGGVLFGLSYWESPFLAEAHSGGGFWDLAPDARVYYGLASNAAERGIGSIPSGSPSPFYLSMLGLWLAGSGTSVPNAIAFNSLCYLVACFVIVLGIVPGSARAASERNAPLLLALLSVTLSPLLLMTSTQVLKDPFFAMLIVVAFVAALRILELLAEPSPRRLLLVAWAAALLVAQFGIAGIRTYYAVFVWVALAAAALCLLWSLREGRGRAMVTSGALLGLLWAALIGGAGPYYSTYADLLRNATGLRIPYVTVYNPTSSPSSMVGDPDASAIPEALLNLRVGFVRSGGATNITSAYDESGRVSIGGVVQQAGLGLLAMFVPMTLLESAAIVDLEGGRGFLFVTDVDTAFITISLLAAIALIYSRRSMWRQHAPALIFGTLLALTCVLLMAFVVTNFGTLFRLRLIGVAPGWLVPLALAAYGRKS